MKFGAPACLLGWLGPVCLILTSIGCCMGQTQPYGQPVILRGGYEGDLFVRCDTSNWHCYGTSDRNLATTFKFSRVLGATGTLQVQGTTLCLNQWGGKCTGEVNLYNCDPVTPNMVWQHKVFFDNTIGNDVGCSNYLWWTGDGKQLVTVYGCFAWQCWWVIENV